jgi:hypothetical protein
LAGKSRTGHSKSSTAFRPSGAGLDRGLVSELGYKMTLLATV